MAESLGLCQGAEVASAAARAAKLEADLRSSRARVRELETVRRQLHNTIQVGAAADVAQPRVRTGEQSSSTYQVSVPLRSKCAT